MKLIFKQTLVLVLFFGLTQAQKTNITVTDLTKIKQITTVQASPDGKNAFFLLKTIEQNKENKEEYDYVSHLYLVNENNQIKALTRGAEGVSQAAWSPDGKRIAFTRVAKPRFQVFVMDIDGGEAWQLTSNKQGVSNPVWSPDGSKIAFTVAYSFSELMKDSVMSQKKMPSWSLEKPGLTNDKVFVSSKVKPNPDGSLEEIRAYLQKDVEDKKAKVFNRLNFQGEATTEPEMVFGHIFIIDVAEGAKDKPLTRGFWNFSKASFTPDGKTILATCGQDSTVHPDRMQTSMVFSMDLEGKNRKTVLKEADKAFSGIEISPDGKKIAITKTTPNLLSFSELIITNIDGSKPEKVDLDRGINNYVWTEDSKTLYFVANSNGGSPLYKYDVASKKLDRLSDFDTGVSDFDLGKNKIYFGKTEVANPSELYVADFNMKGTSKISNLNDWVNNKNLSFPEKRTYKNTLGQTVEYWIMKPTNLTAGKKHPLLLNMHGGPTAMWGPGEFSMWHEFQFMAAKGYGIVYANPRGSSGYGKDFQFANYRDWGVGPTEDVLAAATDAAKESWADANRQVITGGSYAGYLTAWIVSHDDRFKAAFAQRGVYDLKTFMGEGNAWRLTPNYFGLPWDDEAKTKIEFNSPINYVDKIKTPLLIKHGENDLRTGVIQSEMMYKSMKYLGKEVEYVRMPGGTHELSRTGNVRQRIDRLLRIYEFFERYVGQ